MCFIISVCHPSPSISSLPTAVGNLFSLIGRALRSMAGPGLPTLRGSARTTTSSAPAFFTKSSTTVAARPSEIRAFLLRYAHRRGIAVKEYVSEEPGPAAFFCHLAAPPEEPIKTVTAISYECWDNALVMAFLQWQNPELDFLEDKN